MVGQVKDSSPSPLSPADGLMEMEDAKSCYPSVKVGWATKTNIFEDDRGHKTTSFFTCEFFGQFVVH